jgi:hypothetical protein
MAKRKHKKWSGNRPRWNPEGERLHQPAAPAPEQQPVIPAPAAPRSRRQQWVIIGLFAVFAAISLYSLI